MLSEITAGNAKTDGKDFRYWFVGRLEQWSNERDKPFDIKRYGLRNTNDIEIKWGIYKKGDIRDVWALCSNKTAMSILIRGDFTFTFREAENPGRQQEVRLHEEGDYVIWRETVEHTWRMDEDSEILTLRWSQK